MALVDGVATAADSHGIVQGNGADPLNGPGVDKLAGGSGNDKLQGQDAFNQYYGGAGNDTFILAAKFANSAGAHQGQSTAFADQFAYITDFQGAGQVGGDFIALSGFKAGTLQLEHTGVSNTAGAALDYYSVQDLNGHTLNFEINSLSGKALGAGDFNFY